MKFDVLHSTHVAKIPRKIYMLSSDLKSAIWAWIIFESSFFLHREYYHVFSE